MKPSSNIATLIEIMGRLRDPENGCPWDVEQDMQSIVPYTIEEAYEVADAVERGDMVDLKDELGDLLLQPVYLAQLATEDGHFTFDDVVLAITSKMVRRHPHVFGDVDARSAGAAKESWEKIKREEAAQKAEEKRSLGISDHASDNGGLLSSVPMPLPALTRALKLQSKAAQVGFDWNDLRPVMDKIEEEWQELKVELNESGGQPNTRVAEELGDFIFSIVNMARHIGIDPEDALRKTNSKFVRRFGYLENEIQSNGGRMKDAALDEMEELWARAKGVVG